MPISFNDVPKNIRVPFVYVEFDNSRAVEGPALMPYRNLVIGQRLASGSVAAKEPVRVTSEAQAKSFFGAGSMLAQTLARQFENNSFTETWAVALDDADAGVAATWTLSLTGGISPGVINLYIGGRRIQASVAAVDSVPAVAARLAAAITADSDAAVTAVVNGILNTQIDLTAKHKGEVHNDLDIRLNYFDGEVLPDHLNLAIASGVPGAANPSIADIWDLLGDEHYNIITLPYRDGFNLGEIEKELLDRWGPTRMIEGIAVTAATGSHSNLGTFGDTRNSPHLTVMHAAGSPTPTWEWAGAVAGLISEHGNIDPARPFQTLPLVGILPAKELDRFTLQENNLLLYDGISTHSVDAGGLVRIQRLITTYKTSPAGAEDISYLDVNTPLTLAYLRYDFRNYILRKYPRHKLANDGTRFGAGQAIITPKVGKAEAVARARLWEEIGLVENLDQFKNELICERNASDPNRLDWMLPPDLVNQFRIGGVQIAFLL